MNRTEKSIEFRNNHWHLSRALSRILLSCRSKEPSRYALNGVCAAEKALVTTDGRRLVEIEIKHEIPLGLYFCTADGFLLDGGMEGKFPRYQDIIPSSGKLLLLLESNGYGPALLAQTVGRLVQAGCLCDLALLYGPGTLLGEIEPRHISVYVYKSEPENNPFVIEGDCNFGHIRYVQMPITVK